MFYMKIDFIPASNEVENRVDRPKPAKAFIPEWYKNIKVNNNISLNEFGNPTNLSVKNCVPFLDIFMHGYIQSTWCDIYIDFDENENLLYRTSGASILPSIISHRSKQNPIDPLNFYEKIEMSWIAQWTPKTPKGWSILIVNPINHFELPFTTTSGIIDSDKFHHNFTGEIPFYIKRGFKGLIPKGTPMYQIIPIKRESWKSNFNKFNQNKQENLFAEFSKYFVNGYRKFWWQKKNFE